MKKIKLLFLVLLSFLISSFLFLHILKDDSSIYADFPIEIYTLQDLDSIRTDLEADYILMNNLDFDSDSSYDQTDSGWETKKTEWTTGEGWLPIGGSGNHFEGSLNGQGYIISNLFINRPSQSYVGLFGISAGTIQNLNLAEVNVIGASDIFRTDVGALVGHLYGGAEAPYLGVVENSSSSGSVVGRSAVGGLVGYSDGGDIKDSYSVGTVTGYDSVGGLVGVFQVHHDSEKETLVENSYSTAAVVGELKVGGLVGEQLGLATRPIRISNSFAKGNVLGDDNVGGLVGAFDNGVISNCYATGDVVENESYRDGGGIAGLVGYNDSGGQIFKSYATGLVDAGEPEGVGGLVGYNYGEIEDSFWDKETSGMETSPEGTGKTTEQMQSIVTYNDTSTDGLDEEWGIVGIEVFDPEDPSIWYIEDGNDYPKLFFEYTGWEGGEENGGDENGDNGDEENGDENGVVIDEDTTDDTEGEDSTEDGEKSTTEGELPKTGMNILPILIGSILIIFGNILLNKRKNML